MQDFTDLPQVDNFEELFINDIPMIDVRAPIEFQQGAFPNTENLPLMDNADREAIGIRYKEAGQEQAIMLGEQRVNEQVREQRVKAWQSFVKKHPQGVLYCFRGGLRSKISQHWIYEETGLRYPRVKGGYKAMRHFLLETLEAIPNTMQAIIIGGRTGSGKTLLVQQTSHSIDLEKLFHHRGSAFGGHVFSQPSQIDIENTLLIAWLKLRSKGVNRVLLEDEAANIGSRRIPDPLVDTMRRSPLVLIEETLETRINNVYHDYIVCSLQEHQRFLDEEQGLLQWANGLRESLDKIQKRLGGKRYKELKRVLEDALTQHFRENNPEHHKKLIGHILVDYYDPMYDYQLAKKNSRVIFRGETESARAFLSREFGLI